MSIEKKKPAPGVGAGEVKTSENPKALKDYTGPTEEKNVFLHVDPGGREVYFDEKPERLPVLETWAEGGYEHTFVYARAVFGLTDEVLWPIPRGHGWELVGHFDSLGGAFWRRPLRREGGAK